MDNGQLITFQCHLSLPLINQLENITPLSCGRAFSFSKMLVSQTSQ
ncbi:MAG: hypothetical protein IGQ45_06825 [Cyanobacterium sp. T60_A2020_053]|nr:hypothetical protein [Cyanobacterium sp. T60_A2020_053]